MTMHPIFAPAGESEAVPILFVTPASFDQAIEKVDDRERAFVQAAVFEPKAGRHLLVPAADGRLAGVLFGLEDADEPAKDLFRPGALAGLLPAGVYRFANAPHDTRLATLALALNAYQFTRYRKAEARRNKIAARKAKEAEARGTPCRAKAGCCRNRQQQRGHPE